MHSALRTSDCVEWATPQDLFDRLNHVYEFQLDASASKSNAKCKNFFTKKQNGLAQDWHPFRRIWVNPPYGRTIGLWMKKAWEESQKGCLVTCLVPARTDTKWWHNWVDGKSQVTFIKGRLKFVNTKQNRIGNAPFPSALVVYGAYPTETDSNWSIACALDGAGKSDCSR